MTDTELLTLWEIYLSTSRYEIHIRNCVPRLIKDWKGLHEGVKCFGFSLFLEDRGFSRIYSQSEHLGRVLSDCVDKE